MNTPLSSMALVLIASVLGSVGALFLKLGAARLHSLWSLFNWRLGAGAGFYLVSSAIYGWGIKHGQISVLFPMVSLGYIWTLIWARVFIRERITKEKFAGVAMILLGVLLVGVGSR